MVYSPEFLEKIRHEKGFDPFSTNFNKNKFANIIRNKKDYKLANSLIILNINIFNPLLNNVNILTKKSSLSYSQLVKYTICLSNYETHLTQYSFKQKLKKSKEINLITENDTVFENILDITSFQLEFFTYLSFSNKNSLLSFDEKEVDIVSQILHFSNCCFEYKKHYEKAIWSAGEIILNKDNISFNFGDNRFLKSRDIGIKNIQNTLLGAIGDNHIESEVKNFTLNRMNTNPIIVGEINFSIDEQISYRKRAISDCNYVSDFLVFAKSYYSHILQDKLPELYDLNILDCFIIFSEIQHIVNLYQKPVLLSTEEGILNNLKEYLPKISVSSFEKSLIKVLPYKKEVICNFLNKCIYLNSDSKPFDLHIFPLIIVDDNIYFTFNQLERSSIHLMIDNWLSVGDINNSIKGINYEKLVKEKFNHITDSKNSKISVLPIKKIDKFNGQIDLVLKIENLYIVAELKAEVYPINSRKYYSSYHYGDLYKGANQLIETKKFIIENSRILPKELSGITEDNVIFVLITNFPVYDGLKIKGFPIINEETLLNYFYTDRMKIKSVSKGNTQIIEEIMYYNNEKEFIKNLKAYIDNPPFLKFMSKSSSVNKYIYSVNHNMPSIEFEIVEF
ncbi:hypothetical protein ATE84_3421 [Aquimarina sp. MAR_2010_214]|uniref:hypothetical protein n=1 Tax=Aquimarina sp. MAR_2010_214 TaxID=1250026 RepID=UPI000C70184E|nr:hypothetical protein [Aquimarina sp. MAR_2010_214]PKV51346.1 hypothetical protein ATE84_3421 [Aquimarina sp. MAR_2010_214]